jgi:hypothetical protein
MAQGIYTIIPSMIFHHKNQTMKDTIIKAKTKKRELLFFIICFILANCINIYSIIKYSSPWNELYKTIHIVILLTIFIYFLTLIVRLFVKFAYHSLIKKDETNTN